MQTMYSIVKMILHFIVAPDRNHKMHTFKWIGFIKCNIELLGKPFALTHASTQDGYQMTFLYYFSTLFLSLI